MGGRLIRVSEIEPQKIEPLVPEKLEDVISIGRATSCESLRAVT